MTDKPKAERLLLDLVRAELGHSGGVDDKGNAQNTRNEVLERIEKELTEAERPAEQPGTPPTCSMCRVGDPREFKDGRWQHYLIGDDPEWRDCELAGREAPAPQACAACRDRQAEGEVEKGGGMNVHGRLFQARMWRNYAKQWDSSFSRDWVCKILRVSKAECIRRAKINLYLAKRLNRSILFLLAAVCLVGCDSDRVVTRGDLANIDAPSVKDWVERPGFYRGECTHIRDDGEMYPDWDHPVSADGSAIFTVTTGGSVPALDIGVCKFKWDTCADKSRVLLTAQDGTKHCMKLWSTK
jgi:hypothetical protein